MDKIKAGYEKAVEAMEKQKATIERHEKQLGKKVAALVAAGVDMNNLDAYKWVDGRGTEVYWDICEVEHKQDDLKSAKKKLVERERIVADWSEKMGKATAKVELFGKLPQIIIDFAEGYKQRCIEWYMDGIERVAAKLDAAKRDGLEYKEMKKVKAEICRNFGNEFLELVSMREAEQKARVEAINEKRKSDLLETLVYRVKEKTGEITDAGGLQLGMNGEINGTVVGEQGRATVTTIGAGGYNIQCFHFRVLVK